MESRVPPSQTPKTAAGQKESKSLSLRMWVLIISAILFAVFIIQNSQEVEVKFLLVTATTPLYFALIIAGALGALIGWSLNKMRKRDRK